MTHAEGFYRDIFKKFKGSFESIFISGVSPVTLDDVTSGFNIGWHISTKPEFNQMLGFSTEDVHDIFNYYKSTGEVRPDCDVEALRQGTQLHKIIMQFDCWKLWRMDEV